MEYEDFLFLLTIYSKWIQFIVYEYSDKNIVVNISMHNVSGYYQGVYYRFNKNNCENNYKTNYLNSFTHMEIKELSSNEEIYEALRKNNYNNCTVAFNKEDIDRYKAKEVYYSVENNYYIIVLDETYDEAFERELEKWKNRQRDFLTSPMEDTPNTN